MNVLVTGSEGFIGRNLRVALSRRPEVKAHGIDVANVDAELESAARRADFIFHLAGVNRPRDPAEFDSGNAGLTARLIQALADRPTPIVFSSSVQAELDNPYGRSKLKAETSLIEYSKRTGAPVAIFRFPNVFGKWSNPNYNSVVSTFCWNAAHGLPLSVSDPARRVTFVYIDEVVRALVECMDRSWTGVARPAVRETFTVTLDELRRLIESFEASRQNRTLPDLGQPFVRYLYATFMSYVDPADRSQPADLRRDERGWLFELVRSERAGQIFVSSTKPGVTRGNHYHDTKIEKFCVIQGRGVIRMRPVLAPDSVVEYVVSDDPIRIVDIPPGWTHSIENTGTGDMLTIFWANEPFDPARPDTYFEDV